MQDLSDGHVLRQLDPGTALSAVTRAFDDLADGRACDEPRHRTPLPSGSLNVMWATSDALDTIAVKSYVVARPDVRRATHIGISLYRQSTGELLAQVAGDTLGQRRTGAASAFVTGVLGRQLFDEVAVFGTGFQAFGQAEALAAAAPGPVRFNVVGRTASAAQRFVDRLAACGTGTGHVVPAAVALDRSRIVVTATAASEPVLPGERLRPGTHVNAVGSNHARARELDAAAIDRSDLIVVDSRAVAALECGDLLANGRDDHPTVEVAELLRSGITPDPDAVTLFESHGLAVQDLYCAAALLVRDDATSPPPARASARPVHPTL